MTPHRTLLVTDAEEPRPADARTRATDTRSMIAAMLDITLKQGIAAVIAVFLVWFITLGFTADLRAVKTSLEGHIAEQRFYLFAICVNVARDDAGRALCQRPVPIESAHDQQPSRY